MAHAGIDLDSALGNPFMTARGGGGEALRVPARTLSKLVAQGELQQAERLVLAVGHLQAQQHPHTPALVLAPDTVPTRVWRRMPRPRGAYLRVVMAAGRCHAALGALHGSSAAMGALREEVWAASFGTSLAEALELESVISDHDLLLLGETGTGKEVVAAALLASRPGRRDGRPAPAAAINAAAVPQTLIGSELFGHVRGAFTGATHDRLGRIRGAHGGCLFLDEVGDLPATSQVQLLRVMETDLVQPLGSDETFAAEVRYITATHRDLQAMVEQGGFRRDLFHRIADQIIELPPLRERPQDIVPIGMAFLDSNLPPETLPAVRERVEAFLHARPVQRHPFPGNVRELQNLLRSVMLGRQPQLQPGRQDADSAGEIPAAVRSRTATLRQTEDWYLRAVVEEAQGNVSQAARVLGVDRSTVMRRLAD